MKTSRIGGEHTSIEHGLSIILNINVNNTVLTQMPLPPLFDFSF